MEEVVQSAGERAQVQSVLLLTDGLANQGVRDTEGILAKMRELQDPPVHGDVAPKVRARLYVHGIYLCLLMVL
jgi:hypothetical protein